MYKFTQNDVETALESYSKKGYKYETKTTITKYSINNIPIKALYENILLNRNEKWDCTKSGKIRKRLEELGYKIDSKSMEPQSNNKIKKENKKTQIIIKDLIEANQKMWIVGTGVSKKALITNNYYSEPHNQFWKLLYEIGLTSTLYQYSDDKKLEKLSIGLTDIFKEHAGTDANIDLSDLKNNIDDFISKIKKYKPVLILFNGKFSKLKKVQKILQNKLATCGYVENKTYFFCTQSSGSANAYSDIRLKEWQKVADIFKSL